MNLRRLLIVIVILAGTSVLKAHNPVKPAVNSAKLQVIDAESGDPLTGARVTIQGSTLSVLTDSEGYFMLPLSEDQHEMLTISLVSFKTVSVPVSHLSGIASIQMSEK
jgi:hypothetical protein